MIGSSSDMNIRREDPEMLLLSYNNMRSAGFSVFVVFTHASRFMLTRSGYSESFSLSA